MEAPAETGEIRTDRLRLHTRYPIELNLQYKVITKGRIQRLGSGRTLNISSGGVLFTLDDLQKVMDVVDAAKVVELVLDWPLLLQDICMLKLVVRGDIVRRDGEKFALRVNRYEFRTGGIATRH
jgi:hypothetical protein